MSASATLLSVQDLQVHFQVPSESHWPWAKSRTLKAVDGVSFDVHAGETLGIVGESGCGKSTLARSLLNLIPANAGSIRWEGQEMRGAARGRWQALRQHVQMIFQDPLASLNPRMTIGQIIAEPLRTHFPRMPTEDVLRKVRSMMEKVGLTEQQINRYPHEFSGGQCQRIGIARALILQPKLVICDEPVSALDVSIQAQIINLLHDLQAQMGLALIFIAHDLAVVKHISQRILVMYLGHIMEIASKDAIYQNPVHPYTQALLSAIPMPDPHTERNKPPPALSGDLPSPIAPPSGCVFRTRCTLANAACAGQIPPLRAIGPETSIACAKR